MQLKVRVFIASFVMCAVGLVGPALAQCEASLSDITAKEYNRQDDIVKQLYAMSLTRKSFEDAKSSSSFGVSYAGIGVNTSEEDHRRFAEAVQQSTYASLFLRRSSEILKSYGDPVLLQGYLACLAQSGGLHVAVEPKGPDEAVLRITYYRPPGGKEVATVKRITDFSKLAGITVTSDGGCLTPDAVIESNNPCRSTIQFDSPTRPLLFVVNTDAGGGEAYIPPRIRLEVNQRPIPNKYVDAAGNEVPVITTTSHNGDIVGSGGCTAELPPGYTFDGKPSVNAACHPDHHCTFIRGDLVSYTPYKVCINVHCGHAGGNRTACTGVVNGTMTSMRWVPQ